MPEVPSLSGRVIFQYLYDVGGDIDISKISKEKFSPIERPRVRGERLLAPKYEEVGLVPLEVDLGSKKIDKYQTTLEGRIFPIGAVGVYISVEFRNLTFDGLIKLVNLNDGKVKLGGKEVEFDEVPREFFQQLRGSIKSAIQYPYQFLEHPQVYTLVLIAESDPRLDADDFLTKFKKQTAGVLRGEKNWRSLSQKEVDDAIKPYLSYSEGDVVIVDWYSALISGAVEYTDDLVRMIELALVQLLELRTYDRLLDVRAQRAYDGLRAVFKKPSLGIFWKGRAYGELTRATRELAEARIEIMDFLEDARNISKLTGEWYLGKLYRMASERFRIPEWLALVDRKLDQLQELYSISVGRIDTQRLLTLEALIVLLFVIVLVLDILILVK
ncbi:MAG: hypothetical protein AB1476_04810 [Candidatus Hadarchaeota archaeon]